MVSSNKASYEPSRSVASSGAENGFSSSWLLRKLRVYEGGSYATGTVSAEISDLRFFASWFRTHAVRGAST